MAKDYDIKKLEKGPLQRFKNQNLILKKYGEIGLRIYRAITGKRTVEELRKDLDIKKERFDEVIEYLKEAGMVEVAPVGKEKKKKPEKEEIEIPGEEEEAPEEEEEVPEEEPEEIVPEEEEEKPAPPEEEIEIEKPEEITPEEEEIKPIGIEPIEEEEPEEETPEEEEAPEEEKEIPEEEPEEIPEEEVPEEEPIGEEEFGFEGIEEETPEEEGLTPIEKIIKNKYGDIGLQVYNLIDGQKTAEEIMNETGLSESKLIEILDFMDEQGIIKLDYPKGKEKKAPAPPPISEEKKKEEAKAFGPMVEAGGGPGVVTIPSPVEIPVKSGVDIVKSVQFKTKLLLKYKDKGGKVFENIDGKKDVIDISLKLDIPLYKLYDILHYMLDSGMIVMKPITRDEVKKKYGDDGYTVYKRYGREGLMLYELIGKDLTIKQMAEKVTKDHSRIIGMFLFIHEVLGIELPLDRDVLAKQLGV